MLTEIGGGGGVAKRNGNGALVPSVSPSLPPPPHPVTPTTHTHTRPLLQVDELRQQVRILQAVGYNAVEDSGAEGGPSSLVPASLVFVWRLAGHLVRGQILMLLGAAASRTPTAFITPLPQHVCASTHAHAHAYSHPHTLLHAHTPRPGRVPARTASRPRRRRTGCGVPGGRAAGEKPAAGAPAHHAQVAAGGGARWAGPEGGGDERAGGVLLAEEQGGRAWWCGRG